LFASRNTERTSTSSIENRHERSWPSEVSRNRSQAPQELARRITSGKSWGIDGGQILTPAEVKKLVPYIDETIILGGYYQPTVGVVDSLRTDKYGGECADPSRLT